MRTRLSDQCIIPALTCGFQTWTKCSMKREMIQISLKDYKKNEGIWNIKQVKDTREKVAKLKC